LPVRESLFIKLLAPKKIKNESLLSIFCFIWGEAEGDLLPPLAPVFNFATAKNRLLFDDLARCFRGYPVVFLIGFLNWLEEKVLLGLVATLISILVNSSLKDFAIFPTSGF
jgi:hypothetical protein